MICAIIAIWPFYRYNDTILATGEDGELADVVKATRSYQAVDPAEPSALQRRTPGDVQTPSQSGV